MVAAAKIAVVAGAWLLVPAKCCRFVAASICGGDCGNGAGAMVRSVNGEDGCCGGCHGVREEEELAGGSRVCRCSGVAMMVALRRSLRDLRCKGWECLLVVVRNTEKMVFMEVLWRGVDSGEDRRSLPWLLVQKWWLPTWCSGVRWPARLAAAAVWRVVGKLGLGFHV